MGEGGLSIQAIVHFLPIRSKYLSISIFQLFLIWSFSIYLFTEPYIGIYETPVYMYVMMYIIMRTTIAALDITRNFVSEFLTLF